MSDNEIEFTEDYYDAYAEQAYQDYLEHSFYEFCAAMKIDCVVPKAYNPPSDMKTVHNFWEVV